MSNLVKEFSGAVTLNTDWFTDFTINASDESVIVCTLEIVMGTTSTVNITYDGVNFYTLNNGTALTAGRYYSFEIYLKKDDVFNVQNSVTGTVTLMRLIEDDTKQ